MAAMAVWYEQIVFSTHLLTESLATSLFIGAAALVDRNEGRARLDCWRGVAGLRGDLSVSLCRCGRVFALLALTNDWKRWGWLIAGAVPVVLLSGAVDLAMGQWPFQWVWTNVKLNLIEGRSAGFGVQPPGFF